MSLQTVHRQILKRVILLVGNDPNLNRILRGVIARNFPGFFPMECADLNTARESISDMECDLVLAYADAHELLQSSFWKVLPGSTPVILFTDVLEAARPVVAREARVQAIMDHARPRADILSEQLRHALMNRANDLYADLKSRQALWDTDTFLGRAEHVLLLASHSVLLRKAIHGFAMEQLQKDPGAYRLAQFVVENLKQIDSCAGVEPALLWDGAMACMGVSQLDVAKQLLQSLVQKDLAWKSKVYDQLIQIAIKQGDIQARRKLSTQLTDHYESLQDYRGMAAVLSDLGMAVTPSLDESFKLLKAWRHLHETGNETTTLVTLLEQCHKEQCLAELFLRLQLLYRPLSEAARFLAKAPEACAGRDEFWLRIVEYFLHRGEGDTAQAFFELISQECIALNQMKMLNLAYHFNAADYGQPASEIYQRLKGVNENVVIY
jgi:hypothetical protein